MAMTDDDKLILFQRAVSLYVESIPTWPDVLALIAGMTKTKFKNFVKVKMEELQAEDLNESTLHTDIATQKTQRASDVGDVISEIEGV